jgi:hypothetical protein
MKGTTVPTRLLNRSVSDILLMDAATCAAMDALLLSASGAIGGVTDIPPGLLFGAGLVLPPIALFMALVGMRWPENATLVRLVIVGNVFRVVASLALFAAIAPNGFGTLFILAQAAVVAVLAAAEYAALRRADPGKGSEADPAAITRSAP